MGSWESLPLWKVFLGRSFLECLSTVLFGLSDRKHSFVAGLPCTVQPGAMPLPKIRHAGIGSNVVNGRPRLACSVGRAGVIRFAFVQLGSDSPSVAP